MLVAQGKLPEALKSYRDSLAIAERLAEADPSNTGWQRDLSVSYDKVGDVLVAQGNLPEALKSYRDSLAISERLAKADPSNAGWQRDLSVSYNKVGDVLVAQGNLPEGAEGLPRQPRHRRAPGQGRPRQRRLAARSLGVLRQGRRRAGGARQSAPRRSNRSATASPSESASPRPTPATPAGSAISRCPTRRSATCWWRRAISPRRSEYFRDSPRHRRAPGQGRPCERAMAGGRAVVALAPRADTATSRRGAGR